MVPSEREVIFAYAHHIFVNFSIFCVSFQTKRKVNQRFLIESVLIDFK